MPLHMTEELKTINYLYTTTVTTTIPLEPSSPIIVTIDKTSVTFYVTFVIFIC